MSYFPQLYTLSAYSLFKSTFTLENYVKKAKEMGYEKIALTDFNQLSGTIPFFELAKKYQVQPLLGLILTIEGKNQLYDVLVYVKDQVGYEHAMALSTKKQMTDTLTLEEILEKIEGLVLVFLPENPLKEAFEKKDAVSFEALYQKILPYLNQQVYVGIKGEENLDDFKRLQVKSWLQSLQKYQIKSLLLHEVTYLNQEDAFSKSVLEAIGSQETLDLPKVAKTGFSYLWPQEVFQKLLSYEELAETLHFTQKFGDDFTFQPLLKQKLYPHYPLEQGTDAKAYLQKLVEENLPKRVENVTSVYEKRLAYELKVIFEMGFADYFLIVWDVMNYCHQHQIMTGAGRGSAAGSLVAYVLHITDVDPVKYHLLFERFLNPERKSMPDIDMDIPDLKREEILSYVHQKYGHQKVAQIATFGTLAAKQVIKDVARVFGYTPNEAAQMTKLIPNKPKVTLKETLTEVPRFKSQMEETDKSRLLLKTALKLEGLPRHVSTHAAGVVIGDGPLVQWLPLQKGSNDIALTQFAMGAVEKIGLLKMDFLGLKNLTILQDAVNLVRKIFKKDFSLHDISLEDEKTLEVFQKGETAGVFQFESYGIQSVLRRLKPTSFEDVVAVNALYRPGPLTNINHFIARKQGKEEISYLDESLKPVLKNTYGIMVYQEQVMEVAHQLAGFTLGQADILRRAMSKKKKAEMDEQRQNFLKGAVAKGHSEKLADEVYQYIEQFANYGFNRSHAFAYSMVGFQLAYLKAHYPIAFYTALLNSVYNNDDKIKSYFGEIKKYGLKIFPPNINCSKSQFTANEKGITYGLGKIKGLRKDFIKEIITLRKERPFSSVDDFFLRIDNKWLKEEILAPLILVGVFDTFEKNRKKLLQDLPGKIQNIIYSAGSLDLLAVMALKTEEVSDFSLEQRLLNEEKYLGIFLSGHPLEATKKYEELYPVTYIVDFEDKKAFQSFSRFFLFKRNSQNQNQKRRADGFFNSPRLNRRNILYHFSRIISTPFSSI